MSALAEMRVGAALGDIETVGEVNTPVAAIVAPVPVIAKKTPTNATATMSTGPSL
jgi:hypothetical protein